MVDIFGFLVALSRFLVFTAKASSGGAVRRGQQRAVVAEQRRRPHAQASQSKVRCYVAQGDSLLIVQGVARVCRAPHDEVTDSMPKSLLTGGCRFEVEREYVATVDVPLAAEEPGDALIKTLHEGVTTADGVYRADVPGIDGRDVRVVVREGKNRMVRR